MYHKSLFTTIIHTHTHTKYKKEINATRHYHVALHSSSGQTFRTPQNFWDQLTTDSQPHCTKQMILEHNYLNPRIILRPPVADHYSYRQLTSTTEAFWFVRRPCSDSRHTKVPLYKSLCCTYYHYYCSTTGKTTGGSKMNKRACILLFYYYYYSAIVYATHSAMKKWFPKLGTLPPKWHTDAVKMW